MNYRDRLVNLARINCVHSINRQTQLAASNGIYINESSAPSPPVRIPLWSALFWCSGNLKILIDFFFFFFLFSSRMSVCRSACTTARVLFLYWATHNVPSSILPFIMNAASPFKCSHKHTADKNLIKCRLKPNRKTHWLIIFYHIPWSYFFSPLLLLPPLPTLLLSTCSSLGYIFSACQKWRNTSHISPWRREIV